MVLKATAQEQSLGSEFSTKNNQSFQFHYLPFVIPVSRVKYRLSIFGSYHID